MTPDLPTRVREAFEDEYHRLFDASDGTFAAHDEARESALAAVIAVVQEDTAERIGAWLRHVDRLDEIPGATRGMPTHNPLWDAGMAIIHEFGGTTHD